MLQVFAFGLNRSTGQKNIAKRFATAINLNLRSTITKLLPLNSSLSGLSNEPSLIVVAPLVRAHRLGTSKKKLSWA